jgi:ABC-2 type transport system permease protein
MPDWLQAISDALPLSYGVDALVKAGATPGLPASLLMDIAIVLGCVAAALTLGAATLRRRTA